MEDEKQQNTDEEGSECREVKAENFKKGVGDVVKCH